MFRQFESFIRQQTVVSDKEIDLIRSLAIEKTLRRKDFLLRQNEICRYKTFIATGLLRTYSISEQGDEHILRFSPENSWAVDPESFHTGTQSTLTIDAVETSELILWTKSDLRYLFDNIPGLKAYFDMLFSRSVHVLRERVISNISLSTEQKYEQFIENYPEIHARVPLHMVASYLGVARETLSRIRRAQIDNR